MVRSFVCWTFCTVAFVFLTACQKQSEEMQPEESMLAPESQPMESEPGMAGHTLTATLSGAEEVPGPGDEDGTGTFRLTHSEGATEVCYELTAENIDAANAAHVHSGPRGQAGPPAIVLEAPAQGSSEGCVAVEEQVLQDVMANPANYYVNIHNAKFPAGALRGQLAAE